MARGTSRGGACALVTRDDGQRKTATDVIRQTRIHEIPRAHVARLFLYPDERRSVRVGCERLEKAGIEWIELLETKDGDVLAVRLSTPIEKIVKDLSRAEQHLLHV